eukprot:CAMPEP_0180800932 /NCGR_PEP_ID=MMETSP1038_2-20121128/59368_1 /TAXON_ID=632150 /ORGANISM="Azadinium spinosum, Strain 3D9" /LENGTH=101 /DNA_ID=CAMNT_0022840695 /DNA_START=48 /DNA_END=349 /DNA_ORIENTATION=+
MPSSSVVLLICGLIAVNVLPGIAIRANQNAEPKVGKCDEAVITSIGKMLGCGADGCAWKVSVGDGNAAVMKVAREAESAQKSVLKDCTFAQKLQAAGVTRA